METPADDLSWIKAELDDAPLQLVSPEHSDQYEAYDPLSPDSREPSSSLFGDGDAAMGSVSSEHLGSEVTEEEARKLIECFKRTPTRSYMKRPAEENANPVVRYKRMKNNEAVKKCRDRKKLEQEGINKHVQDLRELNVLLKDQLKETREQLAQYRKNAKACRCGKQKQLQEIPDPISTSESVEEEEDEKEEKEKSASPGPSASKEDDEREKEVERLKALLGIQMDDSDELDDEEYFLTEPIPSQEFEFRPPPGEQNDKIRKMWERKQSKEKLVRELRFMKMREKNRSSAEKEDGDKSGGGIFNREELCMDGIKRTVQYQSGSFKERPLLLDFSYPSGGATIASARATVSRDLHDQPAGPGDPPTGEAELQQWLDQGPPLPVAAPRLPLNHRLHYNPNMLMRPGHQQKRIVFRPVTGATSADILRKSQDPYIRSNAPLSQTTYAHARSGLQQGPSVMQHTVKRVQLNPLQVAARKELHKDLEIAQMLRNQRMRIFANEEGQMTTRQLVQHMGLEQTVVGEEAPRSLMRTVQGGNQQFIQLDPTTRAVRVVRQVKPNILGPRSTPATSAQLQRGPQLSSPSDSNDVITLDDE